MMSTTVTPVQTGRQKVARRVQVDASASAIFALLADPHRHPELDGSGTIRDIPIHGPRQLSPGDHFTVGMKQFGVPYKITSVATVVDPYQVIEWQHPMGHRWRWELAETSPGSTEVTEVFDYSTAKAPIVIEALGMHRRNAEGITATLENLAARFS